LKVEFHTSGNERRLEADVELALYRMVQEALSNTVHHAQATQASVKVDFAAQAVNITINDNGVGFEVPKSPTEFVPGGHFGVVGLYERAQLIGAGLEITSAPGKGTQISNCLPIHKKFRKVETFIYGNFRPGTQRYF
jgi:signal transduction histidine kinase